MYHTKVVALVYLVLELNPFDHFKTIFAHPFWNIIMKPYSNVH